MSKKPTKTTPVTHAEHFRLRPVTERPTEADADSEGDIFLFLDGNEASFQKWDESFRENVKAWIPCNLPAHLIPKPETAEERMRREFEEWAKNNSYGISMLADSYEEFSTRCAWEAWQAAKTTP